MSLDLAADEGRYRLEPAHELTAEKLYQRRWALTLLEQTLAKLRDDFVESGKLDRIQDVQQQSLARLNLKFDAPKRAAFAPVSVEDLARPDFLAGERTARDSSYGASARGTTGVRSRADLSTRRALPNFPRPIAGSGKIRPTIKPSLATIEDRAHPLNAHRHRPGLTCMRRPSTNNVAAVLWAALAAMVALHSR
jgi:hypothetical protein